MTQHPRERFRVDLEAKPDDAPAAIRLKRFLKCALRAFGLRCVSVEKLADPIPPPEDDADERD